MIYKQIILLFFIINCGGEYNNSDLVWEQKSDSTRTVLDKINNNDWIDSTAKNYLQKVKTYFKDKIDEKNKIDNKLEN